MERDVNQKNECKDKKYDEETIDIITKLLIIKLMSRAKQVNR
ncbi:hypothetical protein SATMO3_09900 [Sporomusa aerivorans]